MFLSQQTRLRGKLHSLILWKCHKKNYNVFDLSTAVQNGLLAICWLPEVQHLFSLIRTRHLVVRIMYNKGMSLRAILISFDAYLWRNIPAETLTNQWSYDQPIYFMDTTWCQIITLFRWNSYTRCTFSSLIPRCSTLWEIASILPDYALHLLAFARLCTHWFFHLTFLRNHGLLCFTCSLSFHLLNRTLEPSYFVPSVKSSLYATTSIWLKSYFLVKERELNNITLYVNGSRNSVQHIRLFSCVK